MTQRVMMKAWWLIAIVAGGLATQTASADLRTDIEEILNASPLQDISIGISITDAETGRTLVSRDENDQFIPASNMKVLTAGAALHVLGPDFRFRTRLIREGDDLIFVGDGDPGLGDPKLLDMMQIDGLDGLDVETFMNLWVEAIEDEGITEIDRLLVDDRIFDRDFVNETWPVDQLNRWYCAEVAGLNFHLNVLHFFPRPTNGSRPNISEFAPKAGWLHPTNRATSRTGPRDQATVWIARQRNTNNLTFYGNVKSRYTSGNPVRVTFHNPPEFFAGLIAERLEDSGVNVGEYGVVERDAPTPSGDADAIGPVIATPISTALVRCNRDSQNMYAEALLKRIGHEMTGEPGSWTNGGAIIRHVVHERLDNAALASRLFVGDGSGMSRHNKITPALMTAWLNSFHHDDELEAIFVNSLAEPGGDGTLRRRMRNRDLYSMDVQAKSGYINQVSCLSGFVTAPDGRRYSFSVLCNDVPRGQTRHARNIQDDIVEAIAREMSRQTPAAMGSN